MVSFITNLKLILFLLLILNVGLVFLFKNPFRLVKGPFVLFCFLAITFLGYRLLFYPKIDKEIQTEKQAEIKKKGWKYIDDPEMDAGFIIRQQTNGIINSALFRIIGLQTVFAFIAAAIGFFTSSDKKVYGLYALGFLILALLFLT
ncbi:hypothetical protein AHMF7605_04810 [Adhaeribacter arboris]|uniref:Uncharacterized protein n=1 Tax=Adhaeribacter arboris TaxID=2072846 RepID=A0A2T2YBM3_9BACT|nr:hypothetical protein [Adhaeribacter arboris]PSR52893.1 hypothetical protein AHMF7605_04810 [Adhaeribacter arboris]